jgi:hypothetical protein
MMMAAAVASQAGKRRLDVGTAALAKHFAIAAKALV